MSRGCRSVLGRAGLLAAVVTAASPPQSGGGCHMVLSPPVSGLNHMMAGAANEEGRQT